MSFGELRSLLQRQPTTSVWTRACELLESFAPHEFDQMVVPYVQSVTRRWPRELCVAPRSWILKEVNGQAQPYWEVARVLNLSCEYMSLAQIQRLLASDRLDHIEALYMDSNRGGSGVAEALAAATSLRELEVLSIGYNELTPRDISWLASAPALAGLKTLILEGNHKIKAGIGQLASAPFLACLERLDLRDCGLDHSHIKPLFITPMPSLRHLKLDRNSLGDIGFKFVAQACFGPMQSLELLDVDLSDKGLSWLADASWVSTLEFLDLGKNQITDDGLDYLIRQVELEALTRLNLERTSVSLEYVNRLRRTRSSLERVITGVSF